MNQFIITVYHVGDGCDAEYTYSESTRTASELGRIATELSRVFPGPCFRVEVRTVPPIWWSSKERS